jgi:hypothetical protein
MVRNIWFCVLTNSNFRVVKLERVYGVPDNQRAAAAIRKIQKGDLLVFYAVSPRKSVVGKAFAESSSYLTTEREPWDDRLYPYRVRISEVESFVARAKDFLGKVSVFKTIPRGRSIVSISNEDLEVIQRVSIHSK